MADEKNSGALRVSAHVLVQLGEELVTDVEQAILECVKNAYDADAPGCEIEVQTQATGTIAHTDLATRLVKFNKASESVQVSFKDSESKEILFSDDGLPVSPIDDDSMVTRELQWQGAIVIKDKGDGLDLDAIEGSWLVISGSSKRSVDGRKKKTNKGRTPLGDKGVGRLGSMKLGDILLVESAQEPTSPLSSAAFRWTDCQVAATVDEVPVKLVKAIPNQNNFKGTRVSVLGLRDIERWKSSTSGLEITKSLARLISPFEAKSSFPVTVNVDGHKISLVAVTDSLLSRGIAEFHFEWDESPSTDEPVLRCTARFKERLFRSATGGKKQATKASVTFGDDNGASFLNWISTRKRLKRFEIQCRPNREWFIELEQSFTWSDLIPTSGPETAKPGEFNGAFYYFHLNDLGGATEDNEESIEHSADLDVEAVAGRGIDRDTIKEMAGISILRDGFRVRSPGDWLKVSEGMTSGSTYNLRYHNTIGYFSLTGEHNHSLVEKSDREGFVENAAFRGFMAIANTCKIFANEAIESIRRAQDEYVREKNSESSSRDPVTPEKSLDVVQNTVELASAARESVKEIVDSISHGIRLFEQPVDSPDRNATKQAVDTFRSALAAANSIQHKLQTDLRSSSAVHVLRQELSDSKERMLALYESAAVGLSARGLAHELRTHIVEIRKRISSLEKMVKNDKCSEAALPHLRAIRASCSSISSAASLIDPMLPRSRAVKESIGLAPFVQEYIKNRQTSFERDEITVHVIESSATTVRMNRGRLLQVLDNLVRNSVYWLQRGALTLNRKRNKEISVFITPNGFALDDTGPGVDPSYEEIIFDMFVTTKPVNERGQGLGLFIVTQLLAADGCEIYLSPERNSEERRSKFIIDLSAVVEKK